VHRRAKRELDTRAATGTIGFDGAGLPPRRVSAPDRWSVISGPVRRDGAGAPGGPPLASRYGQVEGDLGLGGQFRLHVEDADADATGRVEASEPPRRLQVTTRETEESYRRGKEVPPYEPLTPR
jgi:hypothetical protein